MNLNHTSLPFSLRAAPDFDFDEMMALAQRDPEAFEARRQALLTIELMKGGVHAAPVAQVLDALEQKSVGCSAEERMNLAAEAMVQSARSLTEQFEQLSAATTNLVAQQQAAGLRPVR